MNKIDATTTRPRGSPAAACSALAGKLAMLGDNVKRFYDLCLLVHESKEEMKLLDQQFVDITNEAIAEDAVEWFISGRDVTAQREWEAAHPGWRCTGTGIRKCKQNVPDQATASNKISK